MMNFDGYTPEMLVYFHALSPQLQSAVQAAPQTPQSIETLAAMAEQYAQSGVACAQNMEAADNGLPPE